MFQVLVCSHFCCFNEGVWSGEWSTKHRVYGFHSHLDGIKRGYTSTNYPELSGPLRPWNYLSHCDDLHSGRKPESPLPPLHAHRSLMCCLWICGRLPTDKREPGLCTAHWKVPVDDEGPSPCSAYRALQCEHEHCIRVGFRPVGSKWYEQHYSGETRTECECCQD